MNVSGRQSPVNVSHGDVYDVRLIGDTVLFATARVRWMTLDIAIPLCTTIGDLSHQLHATGLVMDLSSLTRATPSAGIYAIRQMKLFPIERIALLGGGSFIRAFAESVLTIARFPAFQFFEHQGDAIEWAAGNGS